MEELENYSVAKTDIMKLKTGGFHTLESVSECVWCCNNFTLFFIVASHTVTMSINFT